ncbi:ANTAR domain-containing protein [Streptomyces echinoruber]|nr:GAF and ANTAR domain-containing protein [Streptomyces echinoruber]
MSTETSKTLEDALAGSGGLDTLLRDLTDRAVQAVPGAVACSVTVRREGRLMTLAGSAGLPSGLDLRQYEHASGPCVAAAEENAEQYAADLERETRWPEYRRYALSVGVRSVLAVPLAVEGETGAAINFYALRPGALDAGRDRARAFAERAGEAIGAALRLERAQASAADVRTALLTRSVIDQAIGILMAQDRISARTAMERLRRVSQQTNVKLRDLCTDLVARVSGAGAGASTGPGSARPQPRGR